MGLLVEFDVGEYGYNTNVFGVVGDLVPFLATMDFAPACEAFVETFMEEATKLVPVRTGYLQSTINATTDGSHCVAQATAEYAEFVEYGTWCMEAQPYFTPALEKAMAVFHQIAQQIQEGAMREAEEDVIFKAEDLMGRATNPALMTVLIVIIAFAYIVIKEIFNSIMGEAKPKNQLPTITIL